MIRLLASIDIMYCKVYRIHARSGKRMEIVYLVFLPLKNKEDKVNFCLPYMSCHVFKTIIIAKLFYQLEADECKLTTPGSEFVELILQALALCLSRVDKQEMNLEFYRKSEEKDLN